MKKLIAILLVLVILFGLFIWPLDICRWDLMDKIFGEGTKQKVEETVGFTGEEARQAVSGVAGDVSDAIGSFSDSLRDD